MIVPSIDLINGSAVQLVGGQQLELDAGDPLPIARRMARVGEIAVIDLDAAFQRGSNAETIRRLLRLARCRVGGGIRSVGAAIQWLDAGAARVILGTAATPEILSQLPKDRVMAAIDSIDDQVVVDGWRQRTGANVLQKIAELRNCVSGFLVTFVEREGRLAGTRLEAVEKIVAAAGDATITVAGGITTAEEIGELHRMRADAQVGMAIYKGILELGDGIAAILTSDRPDGLWPTIVVDESGLALGMAYSSRATLNEAIQSGQGIYHSRKRGRWVKGETTGAVQELLRVDVDCDHDTLRFTVRQHPPGFCHRQTRTCWGNAAGLSHLNEQLQQRRLTQPAGSYSARLFSDPQLLNAKLIEEAHELAQANQSDEIVHEAADVIYFTMAKLIANGLELADVAAELDRRALVVSRRRGDAKTPLGGQSEPKDGSSSKNG